ncbi:hypothetical protein DXG01_009157 [Tephrocybe rancida]|nr:hypothetical protein DXG01_009157 [Tephrocybe rancida]
MSPSTRLSASKRTFQLLQEDYEARLVVLQTGRVNTKGFIVLPTEILVAIASHYLTIPIPSYQRQLYSKEYLVRQEVLRALSQTSRSLRSIFLPISWERIEVGVDPRGKGPLLKHLSLRKRVATELIRQLEIVTVRDPTLAPYVKIVNVCLTEFSSDTVMEEFSRCLQLFKNLHTIQILVWGYDVDIEKDLRKAFRGVSLPSVRTLVFPPFAAPLLGACCNARIIECSGDFVGESTLNEVVAACPLVELVRGFGNIDYHKNMPKMIKAFPRTRHIVFHDGNRSLSMDIVRQVSQFPDLTTIELDLIHGLGYTEGWDQRSGLFEEPIRKFMCEDASFATRQNRRLLVTRLGSVIRSISLD